MTTVNQELLKHFFNYKLGRLVWKNLPKNSKSTLGSNFGTLYKSGYIRGYLLGKMLLEHRLIWLYHYGEWPKDQLDHINGIRSDNRIENLREVTISQNSYNQKHNGGKSRYKGVTTGTQRSKPWRAHITLNGKTRHLGYFDTEIEAAKAYDNEAKRIFSEHRKLNFG